MQKWLTHRYFKLCFCLAMIAAILFSIRIYQHAQDVHAQQIYAITTVSSPQEVLSALKSDTLLSHKEFNWFLAYFASIAFIILSYLLYLKHLRTNSIKENNERLKAIADNTPGVLFKYEARNLKNIFFFNDKIEQLCGYHKTEFISLLHENLYAIFHKSDYDTILLPSYDKENVSPLQSLTYRIHHKHGHDIWIYDTRQIVKENNKIWYYVTWTDISEMKKTQDRLKISEERYKMILEETGSIVFEWNIHSDTIQFSDLWCPTFGKHLVYRNFLEVTKERYKDVEHSYIPLMEEMIHGKKRNSIECQIKKADDTLVWCRIVAKAIFDENGYLLIILGSILDINEQKVNTLQLEERSRNDGLTKVLNQATIVEMIENYLATSPTTSHYLFVIDIDNFKTINDTYGHHCGDEALQRVASVLKSCFRHNDVIGRIGGDEFLVFMKNVNITDDTFIKAKADSLLCSLQSIKIADQCHLTCSIGISTYPIQGTSYDSLFQVADQALYQTKQHGKNGFHLADTSSDSTPCI